MKNANIAQSRKRLVGTTVALSLAVLVFAAWGIAAAIGSQTDPTPRFVVTPTPDRLGGTQPIQSAREALGQRPGGLVDFVDTVESASIDAALSRFAFERKICDQLIVRGVDECERRRIAKGTELEMFRPDGFDGVGLERGDVRAAVDYFLRGRHASLSLVADRNDGAVFLLFSIDPRPGLRFPGAIAEGGSDVVAVYFVTVPQDPSRIGTYGYQNATTPPLEFMRDEERRGLHSYNVLGASDNLRTTEASSFATIEALSGR